jgi:hypothetical protein
MKTLATLLASASLAAAHGFVQNATIGGKEYDVRALNILLLGIRN